MLYILCLVSIHTRYVESPPWDAGRGDGRAYGHHFSNSSDKPIYEQITTQIKDSIVSGELAAGNQLPSIRALANDLGISAITTKRAYADLEAAGFIETVQGKGCFVAGVNREFLREERLRRVEDLLVQAAREARAAGVSTPELREMFDLVVEGEER